MDLLVAELWCFSSMFHLDLVDETNLNSSAIEQNVLHYFL